MKEDVEQRENSQINFRLIKRIGEKKREPRCLNIRLTYVNTVNSCEVSHCYRGPPNTSVTVRLSVTSCQALLACPSSRQDISFLCLQQEWNRIICCFHYHQACERGSRVCERE